MGARHTLSKVKGSAGEEEKAGKCTACTAACSRSQEARRSEVLLMRLLRHRKSLVVQVVCVQCGVGEKGKR
jgi:Fe-S-cluster-containing hydrogenase component 2